MATLEDYAAVRELVAEVMAEGVGIAVPPDVRETVEAVKELTEQKREGMKNPALPCSFTYQQISQKLGLDRSTAARRVAKAQRHGYLTNRADKGRPAQIGLAEELRDNVEILPTVDGRAERHGDDREALTNGERAWGVHGVCARACARARSYPVILLKN